MRYFVQIRDEKCRPLISLICVRFQKISQKTLGSLVLDAVERSVDPVTNEIQVFKFLNHLYHSTRDYERLAADSLLSRALQAVADSDSDGREEVDAARRRRLVNVADVVLDRAASGREREAERGGRVGHNPYSIDV